MKSELAETILKNTMQHWDVHKQSEETASVQIISEIKYDDYQQYTHGMRYIESLALWLRQFEKEDERDIAYSFIKNHLVFISEEEMRQLVTYAFPIRMKETLMEKTKDFCNRQGITDLQEREEIFRYFRRCSLFLGLSDGAHVDYFRRQNPQLSHEQIFVHYDLSKEKAEDMKNKLCEDEHIVKQHKRNPQLGEPMFSSIFLMDDFAGSGKSYIRYTEEKGWDGKIHKFVERLRGLGYEPEQADIKVVLCLASRQAQDYLKTTLEQFSFSEEWGGRPITVSSMQTIDKVNPRELDGLEELLRKYYDKYKDQGYQSFEDEHFSVGGSESPPYYGFGGCALPLVLAHNTPNNSFPILWWSWDNNVNALFPRVNRHKE